METVIPINVISQRKEKSTSGWVNKVNEVHKHDPFVFFCLIKNGSIFSEMKLHKSHFEIHEPIQVELNVSFIIFGLPMISIPDNQQNMASRSQHQPRYSPTPQNSLEPFQLRLRIDHHHPFHPYPHLRNLFRTHQNRTDLRIPQPEHNHSDADDPHATHSLYSFAASFRSFRMEVVCSLWRSSNPHFSLHSPSWYRTVDEWVGLVVGECKEPKE